jgi:hypothetical protein
MNRAVSWIALGVYGGFNGFGSVLGLALYTRRLPTVQAIRISVIKSAANVSSGLVPLLAAALWASAYDPSIGSTLHATFQLTMAFTGFLPLISLAFLYTRQSQVPVMDPILAQTKSDGDDVTSDSDEEMDLESYFMDYRLKQMQEKLTAAWKDVEADLEEEEDGPLDDDDGDDFGETSALISS